MKSLYLVHSHPRLELPGVQALIWAAENSISDFENSVTLY